MKRATNTHIRMDWSERRDLGLTNISRWILSDTQGADRYLCVRAIHIQTSAPSSSGGYLSVSFKDPLEGFACYVESRLRNLGIFRTISRVSILRGTDFFGPSDDGYSVTFGVPPDTPFTHGAMEILRKVLDALCVDPKSASIQCTQEHFVRVKGGRWLELGIYLKQRFLENPPAGVKKTEVASWQSAV